MAEIRYQVDVRVSIKPDSTGALWSPCESTTTLYDVLTLPHIEAGVLHCDCAENGWHRFPIGNVLSWTLYPYEADEQEANS